MPSIQVFIWPAKDTQHVQHHRESAERDKHTSQYTWNNARVRVNARVEIKFVKLQNVQHV